MHARGAGTLLAILAIASLTACNRDSSTGPTSIDDIALELADYEVGVEADQAGIPGMLLGVSGEPATNNCTYNAGTGRVECAPVNHNGLTVVRSIQFLDAGGNPQESRNQNTVTVNTQVAVNGTATRQDGSVSTVSRSSDKTVTGLGSGQHTHNGAENGSIETTRSTERGTAHISETFSHLTSNVVIPRPTQGDRHPWPISGTTSRSVNSVLTIEGSGESRTRSFSELVTFNGTRLVPVVVTRDGESRECTLDLATHRSDCLRGRPRDGRPPR